MPCDEKTDSDQQIRLPTIYFSAQPRKRRVAEVCIGRYTPGRDTITGRIADTFARTPVKSLTTANRESSWYYTAASTSDAPLAITHLPRISQILGLDNPTPHFPPPDHGL